MRRIARLLFLLVIVPAILWAGEDRITVAVSLQPYATLVKMLGGDRVNVVTLLPPGADPHNFEPKPAVIKAFSVAQVYFTDGSGLDKTWMPRFLGANKNVQVIDVSKGIEWMKLEHEEHGAHGHHHEEMDPHIWTSPTRMRFLAQNIFQELKRLDPKHTIEYVNRASSVQDELALVERQLNEAVISMPKDRRSFIVFHPTYGYLAKDFKLKQYTIEVNGKEPKPRDLANLVKLGRKNNIKNVFVQPQFSKRAAETIAKDLGAVVVETDPLAADFIGNTEKFVKALREASKK
ncbi:putative metal ABC transporter, periplasmic metal-binding adhesion liprotein [Fibrobacter succinogenes subsp. succinogenes S85]|jgi:zinc transport system substrate-binding protein|uniref:Periplasmic solute binding protein n=1 Tax=Fibrobacter succinogenes (strain ATCC 19169 / S85) TaxID=59374 RepID=C9RM02_FIBSS|nr:zinc ABC transporter substrate-binding protein [Fibrobacter succinogenes]ACX74164.1 periplasmic solute binding protein [Fibrobacter succinogenes subsp. succinogenes S85]ADL24704.1 putative metal ABC transporter, periplasmic metal-binding adhesion liprotein [Fibrobacter succinogenes subsp. succinogenes S85]